jgi:hypothetical protein
MSRLLDGPIQPWVGETPEEVDKLDEPDNKAFEVLQDSRISDLRNWDPDGARRSNANSMTYGYQRFKVYRKPEATGSNIFRVRLLPTSPQTQVRFPAQLITPKLSLRNVVTPGGRKECQWEASFDFTKLPVGDFVDLIVEYLSPGQYLERGENSTTLLFEVRSETAELIRWLLLPEGRKYRNVKIIRYPLGKPEKIEVVRIVTEYLADDSTILAYKLLSVQPGFKYEVQWFYK